MSDRLPVGGKRILKSAMSQPITVIGCGISGLSTGIRLLEAGHVVRIVAEELPPHTTSDSAGAIWYPYRCFPEEKALTWGSQTLDTLYTLMNLPECGVFPVEFTEYLPERVSDPWWKNAVREFRRLKPAELPHRYKDGFLFEVPFIDT